MEANMPFTELPSDYTSQTDDDLAALLDGALEAYRALEIGEESSEEDVTAAEVIAAAVKAVRSEQVVRADALAERRARISALEGLDSDETPEPALDGADETAGTPEPVAAAASPVQRAAARTPAIKHPAPAPAVILASADVPGYATGQELDSIDAAGKAILARMRGLPTTRIGEHFARYGAVMLRRPDFGNLAQTAGSDDLHLLRMASDQKRLPGGSLTAAGGWCAPSETLYDLCQLETVEGILSLPEINVTRGGIRYTSGPDFGDIYAGAGSILTEDQVEAGSPAKTCYEVPCPDFDEVRLEAAYVCVKAGLLTNAAYPELVRRVVEGSVTALAHKTNARILTQMEASASPQIQGADGVDNLTAALGSVAWQAEVMRNYWRLGFNATIDVVIPHWLMPLIRADWALRTGVDLLSVSDAEIRAWFTVRNLNLQQVYDWQALTIGASMTASVPAEAKVMLYPSGTWVKGVSDVISLDAVYDSTGLMSNTYTALFAEEGVLAVQRCGATSVVQVPTCVNGNTGAASITECFVHPGGGSAT